MVTCRTEKRDRQREAKAEVAAQLEKSIEKELLERLQKGVYPTDIVNINMKEYEKVSLQASSLLLLQYCIEAAVKGAHRAIEKARCLTVGAMFCMLHRQSVTSYVDGELSYSLFCRFGVIDMLYARHRSAVVNAIAASFASDIGDCSTTD